MADQFTSNEKWRQLGDDPQITDYIKNFGIQAYETKYLPGRITYGHDLVGDPLKNLAEETSDTVAYIAMAMAQQQELITQCNDSRSVLSSILTMLDRMTPNNYRLTKLNIKELIAIHLNNHVDLTDTYPTNKRMY